MSRLGWFGIILSLIYICSIAYLQQDKLLNILDLDLNSFGDFLAGSLGPLGLFWLVLGFFQQGSELRNSIKALDLQTDELKQSVDAQNKMAVATNKQLKLQQEEFALTTQEFTKSRQPKFIVTYLGIDDEISNPTSFGEESPLFHKLSFANVGATACEVEIHLGYGELMTINADEVKWPKVIWPQFETEQFLVELYASDDHGDSIQISINYKDADGKEYVHPCQWVRTTRGKRPKFMIRPILS